MIARTMEAAPQHHRRPRRDVDVDRWASAPPDLLLDIFRRLDATDVIRCAAGCKPWRRTIVRNAASSLRPRPDRFLRDLLVGFFQQGTDLRLLRTPGPFQSMLTVPADTKPNRRDLLYSFVPATATGGVNLALYNKVLSSRDGFLLLARSSVDDLCLCNPMTGGCTFLPA
ncbi:hypothetical protein ACP70R_008122 [Stipagrostis hirtigluma subsp. patula]